MAGVPDLSTGALIKYTLEDLSASIAFDFKRLINPKVIANL